jgi:hypothetical protein
MKTARYTTVNAASPLWRTFLFAILAAVPAFAQHSVTVPYQGNSTTTTATAPGSVTITIPAGCTFANLTVTCPTIPPTPPTPPPGPARTKFAPTGGNDQPALYGLAAKGPVEVTPGILKLSTSTLPNGADIYFDDGVTVTDFAAYQGWSHGFAIDGNQNITLAGSGSPTAAVFQMPLTFAQGNIQNNCVWIENSSNVLISGLRFTKCGEDGIYIGNGAAHVHVTKVHSTNNLRNGLSITDKVTDILVDYSFFNGAQNLAGGIADGVDIEPNGPSEGNPIPGQFSKQVVLDHNDFSGNAGDGLCSCLYFTAPNTPRDFTYTNNTSTGNGLNNFNANGPQGGVKQSGNSWQTSLKAKAKVTKPIPLH